MGLEAARVGLVGLFAVLLLRTYQSGESSSKRDRKGRATPLRCVLSWVL